MPAPYLPSAFFRPLDALVLALVAAGAAWGFLGFSMAPGGKAEIHVDGKRFGWYGLDGPDRDVDVPTAIGKVRLRIGGGAARVIASPCRNKVCIRAGAVRHAHAQLVCMPARLLVLIGEGAPPAAGKETDAVTW